VAREGPVALHANESGAHVEESLRVPAVRDAGKRPVLPRQAHARMLEDEHEETCLPLRETQSPDARNSFAVPHPVLSETNTSVFSVDLRRLKKPNRRDPLPLKHKLDLVQPDRVGPSFNDV